MPSMRSRHVERVQLRTGIGDLGQSGYHSSTPLFPARSTPPAFARNSETSTARAGACTADSPSSSPSAAISDVHSFTENFPSDSLERGGKFEPGLGFPLSPSCPLGDSVPIFSAPKTLNLVEQMEQGLAKKLKGSDGLPVPVECDNPKSDVSQRSESDIDGLTDGSNGNAIADKSRRNNGADSKQSSDINTKVQVNSSVEGKANETFTDVSDNTMPPVNFIGYVGSQCEKAGNTPACVVSSGVGFPSDALALDERQLKRERRKQANRESARKSRLRKQAEYEELLRRWESLNAENVALRSELEQLKGDSEKLRLENAALMEKLEVRGVVHKGATASSNVEADLSLTSNTEKVPNNSDTLDRNMNPDRNTRESSNPETKLHQLLESSSRADTVAAR